MKSSRLLRRWQRRQGRLLAELQQGVRHGQLTGDASQIHALRVTLRRLRLLLRVGRPFYDKSALKAFRRWATKIANATSRIRDLDVALEWLASQPDSAELLELGRLRRERLWRAARPRLRPLTMDVLACLAESPQGRRNSDRLARRVERGEERFRAQIAAELPRFFELEEEGRHQFRRRLRWWRYLRELALPRRKREKDTLLPHLIGAQEAIGDLQNRLVIDLHLKHLRTTPALGGIRRRLDGEREVATRRIREALQGLTQLGLDRPE